MSLCFPSSFKYITNESIRSCVSKHTKGKKNPSVVKLPVDSNVSFLSNKSSKDRSFHGPVTSQGSGIGILGGVSLDSTFDFAKKLVNFKLDDEENGIPFVLCSDPALSKDLLSLERGSFPNVNLAKPGSKCVDQTSVVENLRCKRIFLEKSGVSCIVMPCNVLHSWYDEIAEGCSVPVLNMGVCVANELKEAKLRPLEAGSPLSIGVLTTNVDMVTTIYQEKLEIEGFEVILPDKATMEHAVIPAVEALKRKDTEGAQNLFRIALQVLLVRAVNRIILASDEFRDVLPPDDPLWQKCIDPIDVLARSTVKYAQSVGRSK
ncbi:hypothetical protein F511_04414 [Dorcoceras hygrometricum]|uniref:Aspartate racemase n=1 Tax=Dorcoceras hygrometricum TaxID=472368 RepID=A0A2Z7D596_9LAMI|nr:hypothetical protein F511_04414 [Dorcoceras hygrometricum]